MKRGFINSYLDVTLLLVVFSLSLFLTIIAFYNYNHFQFTSDMFHHFSAIRNIYDGFGPYEGPVDQYVLGKHAYLIYYLIAPFLYLYNDPKILILINIICIFSSSLLVYFLSKKIIGSLEGNNYISFIIAILFLINPTIFKGYFYQPYGFQPDTLATPFFLGIFIFLLKNKILPFMLFSLIILSIKEEFILILPALIIFLIIIQNYFRLGGIHWSKKKIISIVVTYFFFSIIIILTLNFSKSLNNYDYLPAFWNSSIINSELMFNSFLKFFKLIFPVLTFIILIYFFSKFEKKILILIFLLLLSTFLRLSENIIVYGDPNGSAWGNLVLGPIYFILVILTIRIFMQNSEYKKSILIIGFIFYTSLSIINNYLANPSILQAVKFYKLNSSLDEIILETKKIDGKIKKIDQYDYIILPEYLMYPFMKMSHASLEWLEFKNEERKENIIFNASYILIPKNKKISKSIFIPPEKFVKFLRKNKKIVYESDNFVLFSKLN